MEQLFGTVGNKLSSYLSYAQKYASASYNTTMGTTTQSIPIKRKAIFKETRCNACSEVLTALHDPKILQCEHVYCMPCLIRIEYSQVIKCPECREVTILDDSGVEGLESFPHVKKETYDDFESPRGNSSYLSKSFVDVDLSKSVQLETPRGSEDTQDDEDRVHQGEQQEDDFVVLDTNSVNIKPNFYVPFTQSKELCPTLVNHWLSSIWFPPSDLNESKILQEFRPVYIPFYSFHVQTETTYDVETGKTNESGEVDWEEVSGKICGNYEELTTCASYSVDRPLITELLNKQGSFSLNTDRKIPANPPLYDVDLDLKEQVLPIDFGQEEAFELAGKRKVFKGDEKDCKAQIKENYQPEQQRNFHCKTKILKMEHFVILLPVFVSGFTYMNTSYEVMISGNKGVVEGRRPYGSGIIGKMVSTGWSTIKNTINDTV